MPLMGASQESLLGSIYSGNKAYEAKQAEIYSLFLILSARLPSLQTKLDSGEWSYTQEEYATLRDKRIALINLFFENGDYGFNHIDLCGTHREQAFYYAKKSDEENALKHLQSAAEHAIKFITSFDSFDEERTSLVFRGMKGGSWSTSDSDNLAKKLLKKMDDPIFDKIREKEEFVKIKKCLSEYAGKWSVE